ncbi:MAG TPA: hypothetical protein VFX22_07140 [Candidatus Kapabacteria bacterium]|nr:hypothetical protein [Candidatus Kapabacteria bacterium]
MIGELQSPCPEKGAPQWAHTTRFGEFKSYEELSLSLALSRKRIGYSSGAYAGSVRGA